MATERLMQLYFTLASGATLTAEELADRLEVSKPTVHRDIEMLRSAGLTIEGTPNVGYCVETPPEMPPLFLTAAEFRALASGLKALANSSDKGLARSANDVLNKARAVVPQRSRGKFGL
jgi:predicted DNA-binding transcriptional regulator YafY